MIPGWPARAPAWIPVSLVSLLLRIPIIFLPGPGRDEAAYYYWARHLDLAYAPLPLLAVRLFEGLGLPALAAMRLPSVAGGILALFLFDRLLIRYEVPVRRRWVALLALALSPWQMLVGSTLHPDALFLCALLALALALEAGRPVGAGIWGGGAVLAKPTGAVLMPVLVVWVLSRGLSRRTLTALGVLAVAAVSGAAGLTPSMIGEMMEFARLDPSLSPGQRLGLAVGSIALHGGLLLPVAAAQGLGQRVLGLRNGNRNQPGFWIALSLVLFFTGAACFNHQVKGSWFLPALVLLWPRERLRLPRTAVLVLLVLTMASGILMTAAIRMPERAARVERTLGLEPVYPRLAGSREARVSSTRTLSQRAREFSDLGSYADMVLREWQAARGGREDLPRLIVSDDYGLAARLAYPWRDGHPKLWIPGDGMFEDEEPNRPAEGILIVAVRETPERVWPFGPIREIIELPHPVTGEAIFLGVPR